MAGWRARIGGMKAFFSRPHEILHRFKGHASLRDQMKRSSISMVSSPPASACSSRTCVLGMAKNSTVNPSQVDLGHAAHGDEAHQLVPAQALHQVSSILESGAAR